MSPLLDTEAVGGVTFRHLAYAVAASAGTSLHVYQGPSEVMQLIVTAYVIYKIVYQLFLYPYWLSPLRHIPGPPLGTPIVGQFGNIIRGEAGIPQREWTKQYGPIVRAVGPLGIERLILSVSLPLVNDYGDVQY